MSTYATVAVWKYSMSTGMEKLVLLAIADQVDWPSGEYAISEEQLSDMVGRKPRQLRTYIARLEASRELECVRSPGLKTIYRIPQLPGEPDREEEAATIRRRKQQMWAERHAARSGKSQPESAKSTPPDDKPQSDADTSQPKPTKPAPPSATAARAWISVRSRMRGMIPPAQFDSWIAPLRIERISRADHVVTCHVQAPSSDHRRIVEERFAAELRVSLAQALSTPISQLTLEIGAAQP